MEIFFVAAVREYKNIRSIQFNGSCVLCEVSGAEEESG